MYIGLPNNITSNDTKDDIKINFYIMDYSVILNKFSPSSTDKNFVTVIMIDIFCIDSDDDIHFNTIRKTK